MRSTHCRDSGIGSRAYGVGRAAPSRSEEGRVGEEGRSRWVPDHLKKKKKILGLSIRRIKYNMARVVTEEAARQSGSALTLRSLNGLAQLSSACTTTQVRRLVTYTVIS